MTLLASLPVPVSAAPVSTRFSRLAPSASLTLAYTVSIPLPVPVASMTVSVAESTV